MAGREIQHFGNYAVQRLRCGEALADIISDLGGMVLRLRLADSRPVSGGRARELLAVPPARELSADPLFRGRILFPFNDRIPQGRYRWGGRRLQLPVNSPSDGSALHGLVYDRRLDLISDRANERESVLRLSTRLRPGESRGYPFDVTLEVRYLLTERSFTVELSARNSGETDAPLAFGWHPYFSLGERIDGLLLEADCREYVPVDEKLLPTGERRVVAGTPFDYRRAAPIGRAELDVAVTAPTDGRVVLTSTEGRIELHLSGAFRYLQLYTPPDRRSLAIEPVTAATNAFNLPSLGLLTLRPGETAQGRISIVQRTNTPPPLS